MSELIFNYTLNGFIVEQSNALSSIKTGELEVVIYDNTTVASKFPIQNDYVYFISQNFLQDICHPFVITVGPSTDKLKYDIPVLPGRQLTLTGVNRRPAIVVSNLESLEISIVDSQNYGTGGAGAGQYIQTAGPYWS